MRQPDKRNTRQRKLVLDIVKSHNDHPSADLIYLEAREADDKISRGTVYRNLNLLSDSGEIRHVKVPGCDRYDYRCEPHYHIICTKCGKVCDVALDYDKSADAVVSENSGFLIDRHITVFEGICPDCQKQ